MPEPRAYGAAEHAIGDGHPQTGRRGLPAPAGSAAPRQAVVPPGR